MAELNPFLQGRRFKLEQEQRQLNIDVGRRRERGINALADEFGPTAQAPREAIAFRREERVAKAGKLETERRASLDKEEKQDREQKRALTASKSVIGFLREGIKNEVPFEDVIQRVGPALMALGIPEDQIEPLLQQISANPDLLDEFDAAIQAQEKQTQGRFGRLTEAVDPKTGKRVFIRGAPGGGVEKIEGFVPDVALAEQRAATAEGSLDVKRTKINPNLAFFLKGAEKAGAVTGERLNEGLTEARASQLTVEDTTRLIELIDKGIKTGSLAEARLGTARFFQTFLGREDEEIENTDEFIAIQGRAVAQIIKGFGAGTGLSDADREFSEKIAGGLIAVNENAIRRLVGIVKKRAFRTIKEYNRDRDAFVKNVPALEEIFPRIGESKKRKVFVRDPETGQLVPK